LALGANAFDIGLLASAFAAVAALSAIPLGRIMDRVGPQPVMAVGAMVCATGCGLLVVAETIPQMAVTVASLGIGQLSAVVGSHTILATHGTDVARAVRIGYYTSVASLGIAFGPILAGQVMGDVFEPWRASGAFVGAAILALFAAITIAVMPRTRAHLTGRHSADQVRLTAFDVLRRPGMGAAMIAGIAAIGSNELLVAYLPVYGQANGIGPQAIGVALGALSLSQILSRLGMGRMLARFGASQVLAISLLIAGLGVPLILVTAELAWIVIVVSAVGISLGLAQPLTLVWVVRTMPGYSQGLAMGIRMTGNRLGQLAIPVTVGATAGQLGPGAIMLAIAGLLLGAAGLVAVKRKSLDPASGDSVVAGESSA
jgi:MFS family permease